MLDGLRAGVEGVRQVFNCGRERWGIGVGSAGAWGEGLVGVGCG